MSLSRQRKFDLNPVATRNRLLAQLSRSERKALVGMGKVPLEARQVLEVPGAPISVVYFVETGLVSVVGTTRPNHRIEVGMIGFEGMTGTAIVLGDDLSANEAIVQSSGEAFRISASDLRVAMLQHPRMAILFGHYIHVFMTRQPDGGRQWTRPPGRAPRPLDSHVARPYRRRSPRRHP